MTMLRGGNPTALVPYDFEVREVPQEPGAPHGSARKAEWARERDGQRASASGFDVAAGVGQVAS